jgi:hypothetical protein
MSDEDDTTEEGEGVASLRKQYAALKKQLDERDTELGTLRAEKRKSTVAGILKAKGVPEAAASLYNGEDVSDDAVGKWLENYADVFGVKQEAAPDANSQNAQRVSDASFGNSDDTGIGATGQMLGDPAELERLMRSLPYEELQKRGLVPASGGLYT